MSIICSRNAAGPGRRSSSTSFTSRAARGACRAGAQRASPMPVKMRSAPASVPPKNRLSDPKKFLFSVRFFRVDRYGARWHTRAVRRLGGVLVLVLAAAGCRLLPEAASSRARRHPQRAPELRPAPAERGPDVGGPRERLRRPDGVRRGVPDPAGPRVGVAESRRPDVGLPVEAGRPVPRRTAPDGGRRRLQPRPGPEPPRDGPRELPRRGGDGPGGRPARPSRSGPGARSRRSSPSSRPISIVPRDAPETITQPVGTGLVPAGRAESRTVSSCVPVADGWRGRTRPVCP